MKNWVTTLYRTNSSISEIREQKESPKLKQERKKIDELERKLKIWREEIDDCLKEKGYPSRKILIISSCGISVGMIFKEPTDNYSFNIVSRLNKKYLSKAHLILFLDSGYILKNKLTDGKNFSLRSNYLTKDEEEMLDDTIFEGKFTHLIK